MGLFRLLFFKIGQKVYVQGRGTLFDAVRGRVVGEGEDGEEENAPTLTDEEIVAKEKEVENREEGREEKEEEEK